MSKQCGGVQCTHDYNIIIVHARAPRQTHTVKDREKEREEERKREERSWKLRETRRDRLIESRKGISSDDSILRAATVCTFIRVIVCTRTLIGSDDT